MPVRSFREARCAWSCLSSSATTYYWDLVGDSAEGVEYQVVYNQYSPWSDHYEAEGQLCIFVSSQIEERVPTYTYKYSSEPCLNG